MKQQRSPQPRLLLCLAVVSLLALSCSGVETERSDLFDIQTSADTATLRDAADDPDAEQTVDARLDAGDTNTPADAELDGTPSVDAGTDAGTDVALDVPEDAPPDGSVDTGTDGGDTQPTTCEPPLARCDETCVDVRSDVDHCGVCGQRCVAGDNAIADCVAGVCTTDCTPGFVDLDGELGCEYACVPTNNSEEICDGLDNDCDGAIDQGDDSYLPTPCLRNEGVCAGSVRACERGVPQPCTDADYEQFALDMSDAPYQRGEETLCDGVDNDCAGGVDESCCDNRVVDFTRMPADVTPGRTYTSATSVRLDGEWRSYAVSQVDAPSVGSQAVLLQAAGDPIASTLDVRPLGSVVPTQSSLGLTFSGAYVVWSTSGDGVVVEDVSLAGDSLGAPRLAVAAPGATQVAVGQDGVLAFVAYVTPAPDNAERSRWHVRSIFANGDPTLADDEQLGERGVIDNLRLWATPNGVVVCYLERVTTKVKCTPFSATLSAGPAVEGTFVRAEQSLSPFYAHPDGGASAYVVSPRGTCTASSCPYPVFELRVNPDGSVGEQQLALQTQDGAFAAFGGRDAHWFVVREPTEPPDGTFTQALYRRVGDDFERIAILPQTTPEDTLALLDDGEITRLLTRRGPAASSVYSLVGISPDGAPLCPLP